MSPDRGEQRFEAYGIEGLQVRLLGETELDPEYVAKRLDCLLAPQRQAFASASFETLLETLLVLGRFALCESGVAFGGEGINDLIVDDPCVEQRTDQHRPRQGRVGER